MLFFQLILFLIIAAEEHCMHRYLILRKFFFFFLSRAAPSDSGLANRSCMSKVRFFCMVSAVKLTPCNLGAMLDW